MSNTKDDIFAFLFGESTFQGVWYGQPNPNERGAYWWRRHLRAALAAPPAIAGEPVAHTMLARQLATASNNILTGNAGLEDANACMEAATIIAAAPIQSPPEAPAADAGQAGSEPASGAVQLLSKEAIADIIREHLGDTYVCGRVWAAWNVGTMSKNDFTPAAECELADDAADAIRAALASITGAAAMAAGSEPAGAVQVLREALQSFVFEFGDKTNSATVNKARAALASTAGATVMPHVAFVEGDEVVRELRWNANIAAFDYPVGTKLYATPTPAASEPASGAVLVLREALERIAGFTMSQFMGAHDMALECVNVAREALDRKVVAEFVAEWIAVEAAVEAVAKQWDGCMVQMFDPVGNPTERLDVGATIRAGGVPVCTTDAEPADDWVAQVVSSGPADFPLLQWRSADVSFNTPIGAKLYANAALASTAGATVMGAGSEPIPANIAAIIERLHTQDNRITANPLFAVQQKREYVGSDGYNDGGEMRWVDDSGEEADNEEAARLESEYRETYSEPDGWRRVNVFTVWEFVTGCFTEQGCKDYIAVNGHNLNEPRIYAYGSYRNAEFIAIREWLMSLLATPTPVPAALGVTAAAPSRPQRGDVDAGGHPRCACNIRFGFHRPSNSGCPLNAAAVMEDKTNG